MSKFKRIFEQIVTLGQGEKLLRLTTPQGDMKCVAAGDPSTPTSVSARDKVLPEAIMVDGERIETAQYEPFKVCGNSMLPQDIADGNTLLVSVLPIMDYKTGDFLVIRVDPDYYRNYNPKTIFYDYKLRKALFRVAPDVTENELINRLKEYDYSAYLENMQEYAIRKYKRARLAYPDKELMLSTTYHDGELKYSFHPVDLIYGRADVLFTSTNQRLLRAA